MALDLLRVGIRNAMRCHLWRNLKSDSISSTNSESQLFPTSLCSFFFFHLFSPWMKLEQVSSWNTRFCKTTCRGLVGFLVISEFLELSFSSEHSLVSQVYGHGIIEPWNHLRFGSWPNTPVTSSSHPASSYFQWRHSLLPRWPISTFWQGSCED